jgi:polyhydroxyalkanoate synthesis regulator phasin
MKRLIWLPVAGFLLIAGATVAAAAPSIVSVLPSTSGTVDDAVGLRVGGLLEEVLADLVNDGVINQEQSDAIVDALEAKVEERRAEAETRREEMRQAWEQIQGFLEDEVITQDEINQLPEDSPLRDAFNSIAEDGQITLEQLRELRPWGGHGFGPGRGHGPRVLIDGPNFWFDSSDSESDSESNSN